MITFLIRKLKCRLGRHRMVTYPISSLTLSSHRQVIITRTRCIHCDHCTDL